MSPNNSCYAVGHSSAFTEDMNVNNVGEIKKNANVIETPAFKFFNFLLDLPFVHEILFGIYTMQIKAKSKKVGLVWEKTIEEMKSNLQQLEEYRRSITNSFLQTPEYYFVTTHAYKDGNLCWESAMEEDLWSAMIMTPLYEGNKEGHILMREEWLNICAKYIDRPVEFVTDLGCGTGLATFMMEKNFPSIKKMSGIDLSPYKLAICMQKLTKMESRQAQKYSFHHCSAEDISSNTASNTQDLVSMCNVVHESPKIVAENIFSEAYRILRPGGIFTILDVDQSNMESLLTSPLLAAMFKRTEPYIADYLEMDYPASLSKAGFEICEINNSCASHKAIVARKVGG